MDRETRRRLALVVVLVLVNVFIWRMVLVPKPAQVEVPPPTRTPAISPTRTPTRATATSAATATLTRTAGGSPAAATPASTPTRPLATPASITQTRPPAAPASATPTRPLPTPTPAVLTTMDEVMQAANAGRRSVPFRLTFSEQEISEEIAAYLRESGDIGFSDVRVTLQAGEAIITGKARVVAFNVGFKATTTVVVAEGVPRLQVLKLDLLGGLVPGFVKDRLIQMIEQNADLQLLAGVPVTIDRVDIQVSQALVSGTLN